VVARFVYSAANQPCAWLGVPASQSAARCRNLTRSIHGNCHRRKIDSTVAIRKIENFVLGLPGHSPLEPDLIATVKNSSVKSPIA
jgi:hypothetical protein